MCGRGRDRGKEREREGRGPEGDPRTHLGDTGGKRKGSRAISGAFALGRSPRQGLGFLVEVWMQGCPVGTRVFRVRNTSKPGIMVKKEVPNARKHGKRYKKSRFAAH